VTPAGTIVTPKLPASGAGPDPIRYDVCMSSLLLLYRYSVVAIACRLVLGSEGSFGIITEAVLRVQRPPAAREAVTLLFPSFFEAADAVREMCQSGLQPSNCRVVDALEAFGMGAGDGIHSLLLLAFEHVMNDSSIVGANMKAALAIASKHGGSVKPAPKSCVFRFSRTSVQYGPYLP
jgi:alkyldihydroxyacetonephosphate synthase